MGFLDIRIEKTERAIKQAFMELRREKPVEKIRVKELCDRACINKSTFYAHYQDIYALANAMEDEMVHAVVESLPRLTASDVSERTEWLAREMFRAFTAHQPRSACSSPAPGRGCSSTGWSRPCASASPRPTPPLRRT